MSVLGENVNLASSVAVAVVTSLSDATPRYDVDVSRNIPFVDDWVLVKDQPVVFTSSPGFAMRLLVAVPTWSMLMPFEFWTSNVLVLSAFGETTSGPVMVALRFTWPSCQTLVALASVSRSAASI